MTKLIITYLILTVIPITLLGYIAYSQYAKSIENQAGEYIPQLLEQSNENIDNQIKELKRLPDSLYNSSQVIEVLRKDSYQSNSNMLQDKFMVNSYLSRTYTNGGDPDILGVFLHSKNRLFSSTKTTYSGFDIETSSLPYGQDLELQGEEEIILPYETNLKFKDNPPFILLMRQLRDYENQENIGTIFIAVDLNFFEKSLQSLLQRDNSTIWMTDSEGRIIYHTAPGRIGSVDKKFGGYPRINGSFKTNGLENNLLISTDKFQNSDWYLFHSIPVSFLTKETDAVRIGTIAAFIILVLLSTIFSIILAWNVSSPLNKLTKLMKQVEKGNFNVDLPVNSKDEVGMLTNSFNSMIQQINHLIKKNYQIELRQKDAELYALQSQINPHFMYNTLETIGYAVEEGEKDTVVKTVTLLGRMLRYSLNNKDKVVPISLEVTHVKDYLTIQKFRFEDRIDFEIHEEIETRLYYTPKFILQPIIENAIKYGLEQHNKTLIEIFINRSADGEIILTLKDNGPGIKEKKLIELNETFKTNPMAKRDAKFGLVNVNARIAMIFGEEYGLQLKSENHKGTEVIIRIPMLTTPIQEDLIRGVNSTWQGK
ncbi:cache domain-containing sensor histidine kinase [Bacillus sp. AK031]